MTFDPSEKGSAENDNFRLESGVSQGHTALPRCDTELNPTDVLHTARWHDTRQFAHIGTTIPVMIKVPIS